MKRIIATLFILLLVGCTTLDFFSYEENTGLFVIDRPEGYPSISFGSRLAPTSNPQTDMLTVSAGEGNYTVMYKLSESGDLIDPTETDSYLNGTGGDADDVELWGSGASLAGLPFFGADLTGCYAVGEPAASQVTVVCTGIGDETIVGPAETRFGFDLAAIRPSGGNPWLLGVASQEEVVVYSDWLNPAINSSDAFHPVDADDDEIGEIRAIAGGRDTDRVLLAVSAELEIDGPMAVFLFVQSTPNASTFEQVLCIERSDEPGFGGVVEMGDLNMDGVDDLLVSANNAENRVQAVYVYDSAALQASGEPAYPCVSPSPAVILVPQTGVLDVECGSDCDFGLNVAVGDIATDDDGPEIMVGAPGARVEGKGGAGAVYVFRGQDAIGGNPALAGQVADSYPEGDDRFGGGLTVAPMAGRNELVVGATGAGQVFIAFCTGVGEDLTLGADVTTDGNGDVVSTRCRPPAAN